MSEAPAALSTRQQARDRDPREARARADVKSENEVRCLARRPRRTRLTNVRGSGPPRALARPSGGGPRTWFELLLSDACCRSGVASHVARVPGGRPEARLRAVRRLHLVKGGGASIIRVEGQVGGQGSPAHAQKHARAAAGARKGWRQSASPESGGRVSGRRAHVRAGEPGAGAYTAPPCDARGALGRPREAPTQLPPLPSRRLSEVGEGSKWSRVES